MSTRKRNRKSPTITTLQKTTPATTEGREDTSSFASSLTLRQKHRGDGFRGVENSQHIGEQHSTFAQMSTDRPCYLITARRRGYNRPEYAEVRRSGTDRKWRQRWLERAGTSTIQYNGSGNGKIARTEHAVYAPPSLTTLTRENVPGKPAREGEKCERERGR